MRPLLSWILRAALALLAVPACESMRQPDPIADADDVVGSVGLAVQLDGGVSLGSLGYTLTGPHGFSTTGTLDVSKSAIVSATIGGLPAGDGYAITLAGTGSDGATGCSGSSTFSVTAHATTSTSVRLACKEPARSGSVQVSGTINVCAAIDSLSANPGTAHVGGTIALTASAHDLDAGPAAFTYRWDATGGMLSSASAQSPTFTCTTAGTVTVKLTVSDGDPDPACADSATLTVTCSP